MGISQTNVATFEPHVHIIEDRCPLCDQPIPNERAAEVRHRFDVLQRQASSAQIEEVRADERRKAQQQIDKLNEIVKQAESEKNTAIEQGVDKLKEAYNEGKKIMEPEVVDLRRDNAAHALEVQRLLKTVEELKRELENKPPGARGDDGEVDIFEKLKETFADRADQIRRVDKGTAGPDIIHDVIDESKNKCGTIVYECKNTKVWSDHYVTKLHENQSAEKAEHAILSAVKLPPGCDDQIAIRDGIIIAHPARVPMLAEIMRRDILENHKLRKWAKGADQKKDALYTYITSSSFKQHLESVDILTRDMLELDTDEEKQHKRTWRKRNSLIKSMQEAEENLRAGIDEAIGAE
jgi:hypothetical protein